MVKIIDVIEHKNKYYTQTFIVLDEMPAFEYERVGDFLVGEDSGFFSFYGYEKSTEAFCGREFDIPLIGGGVEKASGQWWAATPRDYRELVISTGAGSPKTLEKCNVFTSIHVDAEILEEWIAENEPSNNYYKYDTKSKDFRVQNILSPW